MTYMYYNYAICYQYVHTYPCQCASMRLESISQDSPRGLKFNSAATHPGLTKTTSHLVHNGQQDHVRQELETSYGAKLLSIQLEEREGGREGGREKDYRASYNMICVKNYLLKSALTELVSAPLSCYAWHARQPYSLCQQQCQLLFITLASVAPQRSIMKRHKGS